MIDLGKVRPGRTIRIPFGTFAGATGAPVTMTGNADTDVICYKNGATTGENTTGHTLTVNFDTMTGIHIATLDLAAGAANFYEAGAEYVVVVSDVTVDSQTLRFPLARFTIGMDGAVLDTTVATLASQTSFTLTAGPAEDDALNGCVAYIHDAASAVQCGFAVVSDYTGSTKTVTLTAGTTFTVAAGDNVSVFPPVNSRWTGGALDTAQTGDSYARIGAAGAGLTAVPWNASWDAEVQSECADALTAHTGSSFSAIPWNAAWDAEVQSEVADALAVYDPPTNAEMEARTLVAADYATATNLATVDTVVDNILLYPSRTVVRGTVGTSTTPSTTQFTPSALSPSGASTNQFQGRIIVFDNDTTSTGLRGVATDITASSNATLPLLTFSALPSAPVNGDTFSIV